MISAIIPTIHQVELVQQCVSSFRATTFDLDSEIIVVDDGSSASVQEALIPWARDHNVHFIAKPVNEGFSKAVNAGIAQARGDYILLSNNDIVFQQPGWLNYMVDTMLQDSRIGIVGARLLYANQTIQHGGVVPSLRGNFDHRYRFQPADYPPALAVEDAHAVTGALMLISRALIEEIGPLSEQYFIAYEDVDYCYRAKKHGYRVVYCGTAQAIHLEGYTRGTTKLNKNRYWRYKELEARKLFWSTWREEQL